MFQIIITLLIGLFTTIEIILLVEGIKTRVAVSNSETNFWQNIELINTNLEWLDNIVETHIKEGI